MRSVSCLLALGALLAACGDDVATERAAWMLARESGRTLEITVSAPEGECTAVHRVEVTESRRRVDLAALVRTEVGCADGRPSDTVSVVLEDPVGERRLTGCEPDDPDAVCEAAAP